MAYKLIFSESKRIAKKKKEKFSRLLWVKKQSADQMRELKPAKGRVELAISLSEVCLMIEVAKE